MEVAEGSFCMMGENILEGIQLIITVTCLPVSAGLPTHIYWSDCPKFEMEQLKTQRCTVPIHRRSLQSMCIPEVGFFKQKKGTKIGMYIILHTLLINPMFATT